jgi:hypothetical protein
MTRRERIAAAVAHILARGERPTSRAVLREIGGYRTIDRYGDNGMNGQDLRLFRDAMLARGFTIKNGRWSK